MNIISVISLSMAGDGGGLIILALLLYFVPSIVGWNKENATSIKLLNLLLGWTVIGWIVALIWAATSPRLADYLYTCPKCGYAHKLHQEVKLFVCPQCKTETPMKIKTESPFTFKSKGIINKNPNNPYDNID
jgi:predicted RNA-binding Zn-ribbon protein involved in translation (DUF1610 family)